MSDIDKLIELYYSTINGNIQPSVGVSDIISIMMKHTSEKRVLTKEELNELHPIFLDPDLEKIKEFNDVPIMGLFLIRRLFKVDSIRIPLDEPQNFYQLTEYYSGVLQQL